ncbi:hypothetical protein [Methylobacterium radiotolerans]
MAFGTEAPGFGYSLTFLSGTIVQSQGKIYAAPQLLRAKFGNCVQNELSVHARGAIVRPD